MKINLIAIGKNMPAWVNTAFSDYHKRFPRHCRCELIEITMPKRGKTTSIEKLIKQEGELMAASIPANNHVICLEIEGKNWSTPTLAENLNAWQAGGQDISLLIGGPDGLAENCLALAKTRWSLSNLTLPHPLVRIVVIEQLYRALSILENHPYHR